MHKLLMKASVLTLALLVFSLLGFAQYQSQNQDHPKPSSSSQSGQNSASSSNSGNAKMDSTDQTFVKKAAQDGLGEVQIAQLAQQKSSDPQVKQLAQKLIDDHQKSNDELKSIADRQNIQLPSNLSQQDKDRVDRLSKLSGKQFDEAFLREQVRDHKKDIREFKNEASNGQDPQLKQFAQKNVSVLQEHLSMAQQNESSMGQGSQSSNPATSAPPPPQR